MKKLTMLIIGASLFVATGCTSTLTLGPKANKEKCLNVSADWKHVGVTLPWIKAGTKVDKSE